MAEALSKFVWMDVDLFACILMMSPFSQMYVFVYIMKTILLLSR